VIPRGLVGSNLDVSLNHCAKLITRRKTKCKDEISNSYMVKRDEEGEMIVF